IQVEEKRTGHVWHRGGAHREPDSALLEVLEHAVDRFLAEAAAAGQNGAVHRPHEVAGRQVVQTHDIIGAAAQLDAGDGGLIAEDDRDSSEAGRVADVPDADAGDVGDHAEEGALRGPAGRRLTSAALRRPAETSPATSRAREASPRATGWWATSQFSSS